MFLYHTLRERLRQPPASPERLEKGAKSNQHFPDAAQHRCSSKKHRAYNQLPPFGRSRVCANPGIIGVWKYDHFGFWIWGTKTGSGFAVSLTIIYKPEIPAQLLMTLVSLGQETHSQQYPRSMRQASVTWQ
ncbi:hypothetical protein OBBRIDRAFT_805837 [Obba rivulosa]|uniref:Uncharacterized protein n=1 Tax=Obba rivulosa TaxID=1052685 RepID=A0A8E2AP56_9APHY|nr:hypothetical protein OBBRIDRAFT_805837 [Obba rivulosa]